jgi:hypothetical protein
MMQSREARLRPEFAHLYPGLQSGEWAGAATVGDRVLAGWLIRGGETVIRGRVLLDTHFEFRGGESERGERTGVRARAVRPSAAYAPAALLRGLSPDPV